MDNTTPTHIGFIVDGNRRWAKEQGLTTAHGHKQGYKNLKTITDAAFKHGVQYISAYVFSTENWQRDQREVNDLMKLLRWALTHEMQHFHKENIRLRVIGSRDKLGTSLTTAINNAEKLTQNNTKGTVILCLNYGGRDEIVDAAKKIVSSGVTPEEITPELLAQNLYAPDVPPLDLIIRTSGEQRLSNFMTWQSAYSELMFSQKNWPDFNEQDLEDMLITYGKLQRRFGR